MDRLHDDELPIDLALVRALVDRALPQHAGLALRRLASSGSSNALFRLGDALLVRLPRQPGGSAGIDKEARWLPFVGPGLPVAVPRVVAVCDPDLGYAERWSVVRWIDGDPPAVVTGAAGERPVVPPLDLATVVSALRDLEVPAAAAEDPALRWYRGGPPADVDDDFRASLAACRALPGLSLDLRAVEHAWDRALGADGGRSPGPDHWLHGDLLAENLLVRDARLSAVLDFGGLAVGDPAVDLIAAWEVLDREGRAAFREALAVDEATWQRARGWVLMIAVATFSYYWHTMPSRCGSRLAMVRAVLDDDRWH